MIKNEPFLVTSDSGDSYELLPEFAQQLDVLELGGGNFQIVLNGKSLTAELVAVNLAARQYVFRCGGALFKFKIEDHFERLVKKLGLTSAGAQKVNAIKAPMPGLVLSIPVSVGDRITKGDTLVILEAMKMENLIKSASDGVVRSVHVQQGNAIEKGQLLIEIA